MEPRLLKPNRKGTIVAFAVGAVFAAIGAAMIASGAYAGIVVALIGAVALYAGIGGIVPGQGLYLDEQGFRLKSFGKSWGAEWLEIAGFTPKRVRVGRREDVDVVEIEYQQGVGDAHQPRHRLGQVVGIDERYLIAAYGGLGNEQLGQLLEWYRTGRAGQSE